MCWNILGIQNETIPDTKKNYIQSSFTVNIIQFNYGKNQQAKNKFCFRSQRNQKRQIAMGVLAVNDLGQYLLYLIFDLLDQFHSVKPILIHNRRR